MILKILIIVKHILFYSLFHPQKLCKFIKTMGRNYHCHHWILWIFIEVFILHIVEMVGFVSLFMPLKRINNHIKCMLYI
ncbi:hypothetical protein CICLE_v10023153mg [Citrus x clementina]|uniref:Uncharacterized protein n=1 Tax=Citrus clementina TaxID=85681 RepID=V4U0S9_CITCL|nr:hypothetical protein CICLE_v10023153mg [Citrus x clementina]